MAQRRQQQKPDLPTQEEQNRLNAEIAAAEAEEQQRLDDEEGFSDIEEELRSMQGAKIRIYKKTGGSGSPGAYLFSENTDISMDTLIDRIRNEWGPGIYRARVFGDNNRLRLNRDIEVLAPLREVQQPQQQNGQQNNNQSGFAEVLLEIQRANQRSSDDLRNMMLQQSQSQSELLLKIITADRAAPNTAAGMDAMSLVTLIKALTPEAKESAFESFMKGLEFGKELGSGSEGETMLQTTLKSLGQPLLDLVAAGALTPRIPAPRIQAPQAAQNNNAQKPAIEHKPQQQQKQPETEQQLSPEDQQMLQILRQWQPYIGMLAVAAQQDGEPMTYAEMLLDQLPPDSLEWVIQKEEDYNKIFLFIPQLQQHRQWFDTLRDAVLELIALERQQFDGGAGDDLGDGVSKGHGESGSADIPGQPAPGEQV